MSADARGTLPLAAWRLKRSFAFVAMAAIFMLYLAASAAPTPLYVVYQREFGFSTTTLTLVFAVYVVALIGSLLVLGKLSDYVGRRRVLAGAVALEAVALILFIAAGDVGTLMLARIVQGVATGAAITALPATLVDLDPPHAPGRAGLVNGIAPLAGLALGGLGCGLLVQYAPFPTRLVYGLLLGGTLLAGSVVLVMPETSDRRPGAKASLIPRLRVPPTARADFLAVLPILIAGWALGGLYLSLGPSVAATIFNVGSHLVGGALVALLSGTGAIAAFLFRATPTAKVLTIGSALLTIGTVISLVGVEIHLAALAAAGAFVSGAGFGASTLATFATLARLATPAERGELFAVVYLVAYLAFSIPAVIAGFASTSYGLNSTAMVYAIVVIVLSLLALAAQRLRARQSA